VIRVSGAALAVALGMAVVLTSCVSADVPDDVASYAPTGTGGADAQLIGVLVRDDGCTYVDDEFGERWLPIFPAGSVRWQGDDLVVGSGIHSVGEIVTFSGGEFGSADAVVPEACDDTLPRWQVN
jgi:hypothetical protein